MSSLLKVTTDEEVEALPIGTLVRDADFALWRTVTGWRSVGGVWFPTPELPAEVLWMPEQDCN